MDQDDPHQKVPVQCSNAFVDKKARHVEYSWTQPEGITTARQNKPQPSDLISQPSKLPVVDTSLAQRQSSVAIQGNEPFRFPQGFIEDQRRVIIERPVVAPFDNNKCITSQWGAKQQRPYPVETGKIITELGSQNPPEEDIINRWETSDPNGAQDHELGEKRDLEVQTYKSEFQPLKAAASGKATANSIEAETTVIKAPSHIEEIGVDKLNFGNTATDPRINWPTESDFRTKIDSDFANQDWNQTRRPRQQSLDEMSSSSTQGIVAVPQYMTEFIRNWIRGAHVVTADFLHQNAAGHEQCDVDTYEGTLNKPIRYPHTIRRKFRVLGTLVPDRH
jgi:hypothetical protein